MENKKFKVIDEEFTCLVCHRKVNKLNYTARDHCPFCLYGLHVDVNPGDRACTCKGTLKPIGIKKHKGSYQIVYKCLKCGMMRVNIMADDDDMDELIKISSNG